MKTLPTLTRSELSWRYGCWILLQPLSNLSLRAGSHHKDLGDLPRFLRSCARQGSVWSQGPLGNRRGFRPENACGDIGVQPKLLFPAVGHFYEGRDGNR
jgi:hypothetical protein